MALVDAKTESPVGLRGHDGAAVRVKNVLFATDFSDTSAAAMPYATAICRRFGSTLHLVHVLSEAGLLLMTGGVDYVSMATLYEDAHDEARKKLEELAQRFEDIPHRSHVRHGQVWNNLASLISANEIDLIVVGTHGRTGLGKLLLGSVAEDILRHAQCPVLTVGPKVSGRAKLPAFDKGGHDLAPLELELRQIVFASNFAESSPEIAKQAFALAREFRSRLTLMHVLEEYAQLGRDQRPIEDSVRRLQGLVPKDAEMQYPPETLVEFGPAADRILEVASKREADIIVLGARSSREVGSTHLPWSSAHHVIAHAHCPVLTIREQE
jgi:nucleotide-binding universal stress UspA family protein